MPMPGLIKVQYIGSWASMKELNKHLINLLNWIPRIRFPGTTKASYSDQKMYNEASIIWQAIELNPQLDIAWYNKGYIFKEQGRDSEAIAAFGKFAELLCDRFSTEHKLQPNGIESIKSNVEPNSPENVELGGTPTMSDSELAMFTSRPVIPKPPSPIDQPLQGENL